MEYALEVKNLTKEYKDFAVKDISLKIPKGSVLGLIGENGAGKSTFINSILNIVKPNEGEISILGKDLYTYEKEIKEEIAVIFDRSHYNENLKPSFVGKMLSKIYKNWDNDKFYNLLKEFNIPVDKKIKQFSKGMKMKFEFACALSHSPKFLILDESTSGLDPVFRDEILEILRDFTMDEEHTILMSSHITSDLDKIADQIIMLHKGKILFNEDKESLIEAHALVKGDKSWLNPENRKWFLALEERGFHFEGLTNEKEKVKMSMDSAVVERPTIEDIMVAYIEGRV